MRAKMQSKNSKKEHERQIIVAKFCLSVTPTPRHISSKPRVSVFSWSFVSAREISDHTTRRKSKVICWATAAREKEAVQSNNNNITNINKNERRWD